MYSYLLFLSLSLIFLCKSERVIILLISKHFCIIEYDIIRSWWIVQVVTAQHTVMNSFNIELLIYPNKGLLVNLQLGRFIRVWASSADSETNHISLAAVFVCISIFFCRGERVIMLIIKNHFFIIEQDIVIFILNGSSFLTDPDSSFRIYLLFYLFFHRLPYIICMFLSCWKCCINNERPTGKKHTNVEWDDGGKIGKIIN